MNFLIFTWVVWVILGIVLLALLLYRVSITQYEEDQLFLDGADTAQHRQQEVIFAKLKKIRPAIRLVGGVEGLVTLGIAAFYVMDALRQF